MSFGDTARYVIAFVSAFQCPDSAPLKTSHITCATKFTFHMSLKVPARVALSSRGKVSHAQLVVLKNS